MSIKIHDKEYVMVNVAEWVGKDDLLERKSYLLIETLL